MYVFNRMSAFLAWMLVGAAVYNGYERGFAGDVGTFEVALTFAGIGMFLHALVFFCVIEPPANTMLPTISVWGYVVTALGYAFLVNTEGSSGLMWALVLVNWVLVVWFFIAILREVPAKAQ